MLARIEPVDDDTNAVAWSPDGSEIYLKPATWYFDSIPVETTFGEGSPVFLVPLALFWRKGPRSARRFLNPVKAHLQNITASVRIIFRRWASG